MDKVATFDMVLDSVVGSITGRAPDTSDNIHYQDALPDGDALKHAKQHRFIHNTAHLSAIVGGIGSGKSEGGAIRDVRAALGFIGDEAIPVPNLGMVTAPTYPMLRDATLRSFRDVGDKWIKEFNRSEMRAVMTNGSEVLFRTADDPDKLRGPNLTWWHGDEAALYQADVWRVAIGRLRQHGRGYAWLTTTPKGRDYIHKIFIADNPDSTDYFVQRVRTRDNAFLSEDFIQSLENEYEGDYALQELEGEFVSFEGLIYPEFSRARHVTNDIPAGFARCIAGMDWGYVHPGVINVYGITSDGRVYQIHEEYTRQRGIDEWADVARQLRDIHQISEFVCDPSEPDYIRRFNEKGCKAVAANNTVSTGIQAVKRRLALRADGKPGLMYYPGAIHNFIEKEQYQWAKRKDIALDEPQKANDHTQDAERYAIMAIDPVMQPIKATIGRWA